MLSEFHSVNNVLVAVQNLCYSRCTYQNIFAQYPELRTGIVALQKQLRTKTIFDIDGYLVVEGINVDYVQPYPHTHHHN